MKRLLFILLYCFPIALVAQNSVADLEKLLAETTDAKEKLNICYQLAEEYLSRGDEEKSIQYSDEGINIARSLNDSKILASLYLLNADAYYKDRVYKKAYEKYKNSSDYAKSVKEIELVLESYEGMIQSLKKMNQDDRAARAAEDAITYLKENNNYQKLRGREISFRNDIEKLEKERQSLVQEKQKLQSEMEGLRVKEEKLSQDNSVLAQTNTQLAERQISLAKEKAVVEERVTLQESEISKMSEAAAKFELAQAKRKELIDSLNNRRLLDSISLISSNMELQNAQLKINRNQYIVAIILSLLLLLGALSLLFFVRYRAKKRSNQLLEEKNKAIAEARERSDELLLNILPESIAEELKSTGKAKARQFQEVTVMFADFKNFTKMAEVLTPEDLVQEIDNCFRAFDTIISQYHDIEKIKTIGDAYMCASGFTERKTLPSNIVKAALEFQDYLTLVKKERQALGLPFFEARIGLHTGSVVAGVVGSKKFAYDIWGDSVNTAARMEQNCEVGKVNISQTTYNLVRYKFDCVYRGHIEAKNKGLVEMYYVLQPVEHETDSLVVA